MYDYVVTYCITWVKTSRPDSIYSEDDYGKRPSMYTVQAFQLLYAYVFMVKKKSANKNSKLNYIMSENLHEILYKVRYE